MDIPPSSPLCANMTSSIKPKVHNVCYLYAARENPSTAVFNTHRTHGKDRTCISRDMFANTQTNGQTDVPVTILRSFTGSWVIKLELKTLNWLVSITNVWIKVQTYYGIWQIHSWRNCITSQNCVCFTARRYASAVFAVIACPSVRPSVTSRFTIDMIRDQQ